jgi:hypothetical protein
VSSKGKKKEKGIINQNMGATKGEQKVSKWADILLIIDRVAKKVCSQNFGGRRRMHSISSEVKMGGNVNIINYSLR